MEVLNHDVDWLWNKFNRMIYELYKSVSGSTVSGMNLFDQDRLEAYIANLRGAIDHVVGQPQLDLPETHPKIYVLKESPVTKPVDDDDVSHCIEMLELCREELANSVSSRQPSGLITFDEARARAVLDKAENFLNNYIKVVTPIDMPESAPREPVSGAGRTGI